MRKISPVAAVHAAGNDCSARGLRPSRALPGFFDSLTRSAPYTGGLRVFLLCRERMFLKTMVQQVQGSAGAWKSRDKVRMRAAQACVLRICRISPGPGIHISPDAARIDVGSVAGAAGERLWQDWAMLWLWRRHAENNTDLRNRRREAP